MTTVEKVPDRPRLLRVTNPDEHSVYFFWFRHNTDELLGYVEVASGDSQLIRAGARRIDWGSEFIDGDYEVLTGYGTVGGLTASRLPQSARTLARVPATLMDVLERERGDRSADGTTYGVTDPTTVAPPITQGDEVTWWSGSIGRVHVLSNDSDPQGQGLDVCRVDRSGRAVSGWTQLDNTGFTVESNHYASGTYAITYYACNDARLTPGTVTVHLRRAKPVQVSDHGGTLRIANPNGERVRVGLTRLTDYGPLRQLTIKVPAHGVRHVSVAWHHVQWYASIGHRGGHAGDGTLNR